MTRQQKIRLSLPILGLLVLVAAVMTSRVGLSGSAPTAPLSVEAAMLEPAAGLPAASSAPAAFTSDPILEVDSTTLTTYLAMTSGGQGVKPGVDFRGVDLDGRLRKGSSLGMHLAGNAIGPFAPSTQAIGGVSLMNGGVTQEDVDLAFPADGPRWVIGRTYNAWQDDGSLDSNGPQGRNWFQIAQPEIQLVSDRVYLIYGADRFIEFKLVPESSTTYKATNGAAGAIEMIPLDDEVEWSTDTFVYTDQAGWEWTFFGFHDTSGDAAGQIWKIEAPSGEVAFVGDSDLANDPVTLGYNTGNIAVAYDSEDRRYTFSYTTVDGLLRLTQVEVETKASGTWGSPTGVETIGLVEYSYYGSETYGDPADLKRVEITTRVNDDGNELKREKYYRYWEGTFNSSTNPGHPHGLQYVYDFEGVRQYDWSDATFDDDHLTETLANLAPYASAYYEYDSAKRCTEVSSEAGCGSCGGGAAHGTVLFTYEANGSFSGTSGYDTTWARRALAERADGSFLTQYFDEVGQGLSYLITDATPASGTPSKWVTKVTRNSDGVTTEVATPAAITGYTHSTGAVTSDYTAGLIRYWTLETAGATKGFVLDQRFNRDKTSSQYFEWLRTFTVGSLVVGDTTVYRPLVDDERNYPTAITSGTSGSNLTARAITWHSGTLAPKEITVTWPTVTTANNGSNSATTSRAWLDQVGRTVWTQAEDGVINYTLYSGGLTTMSIRDADTTLTGSGQVFNGITMPGWSLGSGPMHRVDSMTYDDGFQRTVTQADGRKLVTYKSVLLDRRLVSLSYGNLVGTTFHGPVEFSVSNHSGRTDAQGRVALSGNTTTSATSAHVTETSADPLVALALGTVCRYRTSVYDETGVELAKSRTYFDVPSSSPGTLGTHYDEETYAYDSMGRQNRRETPHAGLSAGTVYKSAFDVLGRVTSRSIGTDDTGTGSDNMVVTELLVYDGGADDGNSHQTTRTERTTATSSGERVTDYSYDIRGNLLLTDAPTAPHTLVKYDNMGRELARGQYGGAAPAATSDPESLATNRLALSSSVYDERGRVCQSYFYNIDPSDGSNDGSLRTDSWYDATGRSIMTEGTALTKSFYDRLGRVTHSFVLAKEDNTNKRTYAAADDVTDDIVLVEHQTTYESDDSDDVLMRATIERFHDDYGGSETTGALDTNADADSLAFTAANVEGRIQITAMWYDDMGRLEDVVEYGTYGGASFDRGSLSVPARSDDALRTTLDYDDSGDRFSVVDPKGIETRYGFDDAGRQTSVNRNYEDGTPESLEPDKDQIVRYAYVNGLRTTYTADLAGTDQVTTYYYGPPKGIGAGDTAIATTNLLYQVGYPDSTGASDRMTYAYNAQGQEIYRLDQDGTVLDKTYDASGRLTADVASTIGTNIDGLGIGTDIDGAVRRKEFAYDGLGRMTTATQYDATTSGNVVDQFEYTYGEWGQMTGFASDVDSVVGASGIAAHEVSIDYTASWAAGAPTTNSGARSIIPTSLTMPTGYVYDYVQDSTGYHEAAGRTNAVEHSSTTVAAFEFVGAQRVSRLALTAHDFVMDYADGASGGSYADWDRFNRVIEDEWVKDLATDRTFLQRGYTLDRGGFITEVYDYIEKDTSSVRQMDTLLTLDDLDRLTDLQRGTLSGGSISNETMEWNRALDAVGNITDDLLDWNNDGDGLDTDEHDKDLTFTAANEIDDIDTDDVIYSKSGMLLDEPRLQFVYDAWRRTVEVINASGPATLAYYRRNALDHLIGEQLDREPDADIDANDYWEYFLCRPSDMGVLASFRGSDADALVERLWLGSLSASGTGGFDASAVLEVRDDDYDGTADRDTVLFIDRTGSVIAHYGDDGSNGRQLERVFYDMNGAPFLMPWGDVDGDGDADSTDANWISFLWSFSMYDVRADLDLDGDVDSSDVSAHITNTGGTKLSNGSSPIGAQALHSRYGLSYAWMRVQSQTLGLWTSRDPAGYLGEPSLYALLYGNALVFSDPSGLCPKDWPPSGKIDSPGKHEYKIPGECPAFITIENPSTAAPPGAAYGNSFISFNPVPSSAQADAPQFRDTSSPGSCSSGTPCKFHFSGTIDVDEEGGAPTDREFYEHWHGKGTWKTGPNNASNRGSHHPNWGRAAKGSGTGPGNGYPNAIPGEPPNGSSNSYVQFDTAIECGANPEWVTFIVIPPAGNYQSRALNAGESVTFTVTFSCGRCNTGNGPGCVGNL
ncbi:MAG: hypothetical protein R3F49_05795 [Planctomycetota bacterium]